MKLIILLCLFPLILPGQASAWSSEGHEIVAIIAQKHLTPEARDAVLDMLQIEGETSMATVALWADKVSRLAVPVQPSHVVRLPLDNSRYDPGISCKANRCILAAIDADIATLSDGTMPIEAKVMALKYLIHFIGDLHQPLHTSSDIGSRPVTSGNKKQKLHKIWDAGIIRDRKLKAEALAKEVDGSPWDVNLEGTPAEWAMEGRDIARDIIFPQLPEEIRNGVMIMPASYNSRNWPIVERRLKEAGLRLAFILNNIFAGNEIRY